MKAELFKRIFHIQQEKLDICLEFNEKVSELMTRYIEDIPSNFKRDFILIAQEFVDKYNKLLGMEGDTNEEEKE